MLKTKAQEPTFFDEFIQHNFIPIDPHVLFLACLLEFLENLSDVEASKKIFDVPLYRYFVGLRPLLRKMV